MQKVSKYKTAHIYAKAWFDAARDLKIQDSVFEEVSALLESVEGNKELWEKLFAPVDDNLLEVMALLTKKLKLSKISRAALDEICKNGKLKLIEFILRDFQKFYYQDGGITEVMVDTAFALTPKQDQKLKQVLTEVLDKEVKVIYRLKPEVLGGLAVSFDSFIFDDTLAFKLEQIKQAMMAK